MKILVLNGSPKGQNSITLQTVRYLELLHTEAVFEVLDVGSRIKSLEKDFSAVEAAFSDADIILFSYPVYTFIAPYQLHRFIELLKSSGISTAGKTVSQITTSKHFYDVTAHRYIQDNCQEMDMNFVRGLSADMDDLLCEKGQKAARDFYDFLVWSHEKRVFEPCSVKPSEFTPVKATVPDRENSAEGDVVILTDCAENDAVLGSMIDRFRAVMPRRTRVINIAEYPFKGGCLGCFGCAVSGKCVYKDGFDDFLRNEIQTAQAIVTAFTVKEHSMGAIFKLYDDRQFCNGHRAVTMGMPIGYLVSGNYDNEYNLQMILQARAQVGGNFLAGIASNEKDPDSCIDALAKSLEYAIRNSYVPPQNFYGVGGMKIFRDLIWLMQGMMKADHRFYKQHKQYDFPQKKRGTILKMYLVGALLSSTKLKKQMGGKMSEGMLMPYKKVLDSVKK